MKYPQSQAGFTPVHALLGLVIISIIGFAGWKVYETNKFANPAESSSQVSTTKQPDSQPAQAKIPDDWVEYKNEELGFKFAYPKEWGAVKVVKYEKTGYSNYSYNKPTEPDGSPSTEIRFSNSKVLVTSKSTKYMYGPMGGTSLTIATGFCVNNGNYFLEYQNYKNESSEGYSANGVKCSDQELKDVEVISSKIIYDKDYEELGEGYSQHVTLGIFRVDNPEFPGWLIKDDSAPNNDVVKAVLKTIKEL